MLLTPEDVQLLLSRGRKRDMPDVSIPLEVMNRKNRKYLEGMEHMERKKMDTEDKRGFLMRKEYEYQATIKAVSEENEELKEQLQRNHTAPGGRSNPRFEVGQSVFQWWASWFEKGQKLKRYKKSKRPAWFSGEISAPPVYIEDMVYGGLPYTGWCYHTN